MLGLDSLLFLKPQIREKGADLVEYTLRKIGLKKGFCGSFSVQCVQLRHL